MGKKKNLILNSKDTKIVIICFMKIVKEVADIELKGEMSLYLDKTLKKIEMIMDDYCNYAFYDVLKWQILSIKKYAVDKIIDISLRESDCELITRKVDRIIKNMQEEIEIVFDEYANKLEVNRKINIYPKKILTNLKSGFIKIQKSIQNNPIFKKKNI